MSLLRGQRCTWTWSLTEPGDKLVVSKSKVPSHLLQESLGLQVYATTQDLMLLQQVLLPAEPTPQRRHSPPHF